MQTSEYKNIYLNEQTHFFYKTTHSIILTLIKKHLQSRGKLKILDAGCGTGLLTQKLGFLGQVWGVDISVSALSFAKKRGLSRLNRASIDSLPFSGKKFDLITCVDVLYHTKVNDKKAIKEFCRVLKPGGTLV